MIYDCFMFYNENDCLDIRFQELDPVVDRFVIVQGSETFRGNPKPDYFDYDRFKKYEDKIFMVHLDYQQQTNDPWLREETQRNSILMGLTDAKPDDIVIISDADEIPRRSVIATIEPVGIDALMMQVFMGGINTLAPNRHTIRVCRMKDMTTPQEVRKYPLDHVIELGGWEFSSLATPEGISDKLKAFSHFELDTPEVTDPQAIYQRMVEGFDPYGFGVRLELVQIDDSWPEAIKNDRDKWRKFEW